MRCTPRAWPRTRNSSGGRRTWREFRAERAKKYVSLNEAERRAERDKQDAKRKQRQAERKALGLALDPLADDYGDDGLQANERNIAEGRRAREAGREASRIRCCANRPRSWPTPSTLLSNDRTAVGAGVAGIDACRATGRTNAFRRLGRRCPKRRMRQEFG